MRLQVSARTSQLPSTPADSRQVPPAHHLRRAVCTKTKFKAKCNRLLQQRRDRNKKKSEKKPPRATWDVYIPPIQATDERRKSNKSSYKPLASSGSSSKTKPKHKEGTLSLDTHKPSASWPPPNDTNYSKVSSSVPELVQKQPKSPVHAPDSPVLAPFEYTSAQPKHKFVTCELCGLKDLSSVRQLKLHQASKRCKNRQLGEEAYYCDICKCYFDTIHNYYRHVCRLN